MLYGNATRVAYTIGPVAGSTIRGVASFGRSTQFNCAGATELALNYRVLEPQSDPHSVHLRLTLLEGSECGAGCDASWPGRSLENYVSFQPLLLDDTSGGWHTLRVDLCGGPGPDKPFWRSDSYGSLGDGALDVSALRGWTITFVGPAVMLGASSGVVEFAELACAGPRVFGNVLDGPDREAAPPEWSISPVDGPGTVVVTVGGGALRVAFEGVARQSVTVRHELPPDARYDIDAGAVSVRIDPGNAVVETVPLFGDLIDAARYYVDRGLLDKRRGIDDDDAGVPDFEPGTDGRRHDVPDEARERARRTFARQRSTMQSFRHLPPRSLSSHSTQGEAFRRMPSRSTGGSSMLSPSLAGSPPRRSASTASARSARLFLGPRSLGAEE